MKKVVLLFLIVLIAGNVVAMEDPITVQANPGDNVRIYVWNTVNDSKTLLNWVEGVADEKGLFSKTFFSLHEPNPEFQIKTFAGTQLLKEETFNQQGILNPLFIDCAGGECTISIDTRPEVNQVEEEIAELFEEVTEEETGEEEPSMETETTDAEEADNLPLTGNSIFKTDEGDIRWSTISIIVGAFIILAILIGLKKRKKNPSKRKGKLSPEEQELEELEGKLKEKDEEIKKIKEAQARKQKITEAKVKLAREESELGNLKRETDPNVKKIEEAKAKLAEEDKELSSLKE